MLLDREQWEGAAACPSNGLSAKLRPREKYHAATGRERLQGSGWAVSFSALLGGGHGSLST
jgi:hypothetical protein